MQGAGRMTAAAGTGCRPQVPVWANSAARAARTKLKLAPVAIAGVAAACLAGMACGRRVGDEDGRPARSPPVAPVGDASMPRTSIARPSGPPDPPARAGPGDSSPPDAAASDSTSQFRAREEPGVIGAWPADAAHDEPVALDQDAADLLDRVSEAVPATSRVGLSDLPSCVDLPELDREHWFTLMPLGGVEVSDMHVIPLASAVDSGVGLMCTRDGPGAEGNWLVEFEELVPGGGGIRGVLAALRCDSQQGSTLLFQWREATPAACAALANGWLQLSAAGQWRCIALRCPLRIPPLKLDFARDRQILPLAIDMRPAMEQLFLQVHHLDELSPAARFRQASAEARFDREIVIEFDNLKGAEIGLKLARAPAGSIAIVMDCRFQEGSARDFPLTYEQLQRTHYQASRSHGEALAKIAALQKSLKSAERQLDSTRRYVPADATEQQRKLTEILRIGTAMRDMNRRLEYAHRQARAAKLRLNATPQVLAFLRSLDGRSIPVRVLARSSMGEIVYVDGTAPP
jgi:hypothetical protein